MSPVVDDAFWGWRSVLTLQTPATPLGSGMGGPGITGPGPKGPEPTGPEGPGPFGPEARKNNTGHNVLKPKAETTGSRSLPLPPSPSNPGERAEKETGNRVKRAAKEAEKEKEKKKKEEEEENKDTKQEKKGKKATKTKTKEKKEKEDKEKKKDETKNTRQKKKGKKAEQKETEEKDSSSKEKIKELGLDWKKQYVPEPQDFEIPPQKEEKDLGSNDLVRVLDLYEFEKPFDQAKYPTRRAIKLDWDPTYARLKVISRLRKYKGYRGREYQPDW